MSRKRSLPADRRAVSVTITHVLTIAITTILISGLLIGTGTLLDNQKDRATYDEKSTIGDRLATEITAVDQAAQRADGDPDPATVTVQTEHPRRVSGGQYFVTLHDDASECDTWDPNQCLVIESGQTNSVEVPLNVETTLDAPKTVQGGDIWIHYNGSEITITQERP